MQELASLLRTAQLYFHAAHNMTTGQTFHEDHEFFAELYTAYETDYDNVVERLLGKDQLPEFARFAKDAAAFLEKAELKSVEKMYEYALKFEQLICQMVEKECAKKPTQGTLQMLGDIANLSEVRQYKIKQRLK